MVKDMEISYSVNLCDSRGSVIDSGIFLFFEGTSLIVKVKNMRELDAMIDELHDLRSQIKYEKIG